MNLPGINRARMALWKSRVEGIVRDPPGSDLPEEPKASDHNVRFTRASTWSIVCEEVLDTQFSHAYFQSAHAELNRRGISDAEIQEMRRIAWLTAGWLNYECLLWDWVSLDENDIHRAIEKQFAEGFITEAERDRWTEFVRRYEPTGPPPDGPAYNARS